LYPVSEIDFDRQTDEETGAPMFYRAYEHDMHENSQLHLRVILVKAMLGLSKNCETVICMAY